MSHAAERLEAAREAVVLASGVCRQVQGVLDRVRAITKDDKSPVTVADFASQVVVTKTLRDRLGDLVMVAEEDSGFLRQPGHEAHLDAAVEAAREALPDIDRDAFLQEIDMGSEIESAHGVAASSAGAGGFWTLDPIDGTKGFLRGQQYAIALAYVENGEPVVAAMACPNLPHDFARPFDEPDPVGCVYEAIRGDGAALYRADTRESITIRRPDHAEGEPVRVCASVEAAHTNLSDTDRILGHLSEHTGTPQGEPARLDSQAKYAVTARGQADAYLRLPTKPGYVERIWDHAAGALIATEAGCSVTDIRGKSLDFGHGRGLERNRGVVCAPPRVHGLILGAIDALGIKPA
ncbi:MAG: 3'(2'),5'-bisphosphate nucleotidase [Planctomycetota bacterium]